MLLEIITLALVAMVTGVTARGSTSNSAYFDCDTMAPPSEQSVGRQSTDPVPLLFSVFFKKSRMFQLAPGDTLTVKLEFTGPNDIAEYVCIANYIMHNDPIGIWSVSSSKVTTKSCQLENDSLTSPEKTITPRNTEIVAYWTAPNTELINKIEFQCSVMDVNRNYWVRWNSMAIN